jgi:nucleoside-diphosphate-sugar epimerase
MTKPRIFVAGHKGMVGSALLRLLKKQEVEIITREEIRT